jgi:hypothetical protein
MHRVARALRDRQRLSGEQRFVELQALGLRKARRRRERGRLRRGTAGRRRTTSAPGDAHRRSPSRSTWARAGSKDRAAPRPRALGLALLRDGNGEYHEHRGAEDQRLAQSAEHDSRSRGRDEQQEHRLAQHLEARREHAAGCGAGKRVRSFGGEPPRRFSR